MVTRLSPWMQPPPGLGIERPSFSVYVRSAGSRSDSGSDSGIGEEGAKGVGEEGH